MFAETSAAQISRSEVIAALETHRPFFINFFIGEQLTFPVPDFHVEIFNYMTDMSCSQFAIAVPRGHAKTTIAKLACVWYLLFTDFRFIVYVSNTAAVAKAALSDIVDYIECENFRAVFGNVEFTRKAEGDGWFEFALVLPDGRKKKCILRALGAGQQVRGLNINNQRPELAVIDDLEDTENTATEHQYIKLKRWFYGPFKKAMARDYKLIHIGNVVANQCLIYEHCTSEHWHSMLYGSIRSDGTPLWPDLWPLEKLREDFLEYQSQGLTGVWFAEMMNMPTMGSNRLIDPDDIIYRPRPVEGTTLQNFITIDLAISKKEWAHKTAIVVHAYDGEFWQPVDFVHRAGMNPIDVFYAMYDLALKWGVSAVGIEAVAYQASLKDMFDYICTTLGIEGMQFLDIHTGGARKVTRLASWAGLLKNGTYALPLGDFEITNQLIRFDPQAENNQDDLIDSCASGVYMITHYQDEIAQHLSAGQGLNAPGPHYRTIDIASF